MGSPERPLEPGSRPGSVRIYAELDLTGDPTNPAVALAMVRAALAPLPYPGTKLDLEVGLLNSNDWLSSASEKGRDPSPACARCQDHWSAHYVSLEGADAFTGCRGRFERFGGSDEYDWDWSEDCDCDGYDEGQPGAELPPSPEPVKTKVLARAVYAAALQLWPRLEGIHAERRRAVALALITALGAKVLDRSL